MLHRAMRVCRHPAALVWVFSSLIQISPVVAEDHTSSGPGAGFAIVEAARNGSNGAQDARLINLLKEGAEAYRRADFSVAVDFYEEAQTVAPDRPEVQRLLQLASEKRAQKRDALESIPKTKSKRDQYFKTLYDQGREQFRQKDYSAAYETLNSLWLVRGDYKDVLDLMEKSRAKANLPDDAHAEPKDPPILPAATETEPKSTAPAVPEAHSEITSTAAAPTAPPETSVVAVSNSAPAPRASEEDRLKVDNLILQAQYEAQSGRKEAAQNLYEEALKVQPESRVAKRGLDMLKNEKAVTAAPAAEIAPPPAREVAAPEAAAAIAQTSVVEKSSPAEPAPKEVASLPPQSSEPPAAVVSPAPPSVEAKPSRVEDTKRRAAELVAQGKSAIENKNYDFARQSFQEALSIDPANTAAKKGLQKAESARVTAALDAAQGLVSENRLEEARASYVAVLAEDPTNKKARKAIEDVEARLTKQQAEADQIRLDQDLEAARAQLDQGNYTGAQAALEEILHRSPQFAPAHVEMARLTSLRQAAAEARERAQREVAAVAPAAPPSTPVASEPPAASASAESRPLPVSVAPASAQARAISEPPATEHASSASARIEQIASSKAEPVEIAAAPAEKPPATPPPVKMAAPASKAERQQVMARQQQLDEMFERATRQYKQEHDLEGARKTWSEMLQIAPGEKRATTYLEQTQPEWEKHQEDLKLQAAAEVRKKDRQQLLESPITIQTERPTALNDFMRLISLSTAKEMQYYIADGAQADIFANFTDKPLKDLLDDVLLPVGLTWDINENNLITIKTDLTSQTFNLTTEQMNKIRSLLDSGTLKDIIWGQREKPSKGVELTLDERQRVLVAVGSKLHQEKLKNFLSNLQTSQTPDLEMKFYKIREDDGPKIKSLVNAMITAGSGTPFDLERKLLIDGPDLIIRDTPENIVKIEELLLNEKFIEDLRGEKLEIQNFSLIPRDVENRGADFATSFTSRVIESIETFLYARTGRTAAQSEGRRLWYDPATFQLTLVDTPTNINTVADFINSLPELRQRELQKVVFVVNQGVDSLASELSQILNLAEPQGGSGGGSGGGQEISRKVRRGDSFEFRDLRITMTRVEPGDVNDKLDDEVELNVVSGTQSNQIRIRELESFFFEDYEISAEDVQPAGVNTGTSGSGQNTRRGEGTAKLKIRYVPPIDGGNGGAPGAPGGGAAAPAAAAPQQQQAPDDPGITINPFAPLNALIIRYDNPAAFAEVQQLIKELDKPTKQVEVETKFVQVDETRAREFSSQIDLAGLSSMGAQGMKNLDTDFWKLNSRFAQTVDEFRSSTEPPIENPLNANLIKGTTVLDLVIGNGAPSIGFQLRLLEAEGILNITNGPKVTMLNNVEGEFRIEKIGPFGTTGGGQGGPAAFRQSIVDPFGTGAAGQDTLANEDSSQFQNRLTSVILLVTPEITSEKSIIFDIQAEILDMDTNLGVNFFMQQGGTITNINPLQEEPVVDIDGDVLTTNDIRTPGPFKSAILNTSALLRTRKLINTTARIADGGTIVLGGWTGERSQDLASGVPVLRNMPYFGKLLFSRSQRSTEKTTMLVFLTGNLID